jgi:DNA-binding NtrC family response regulator
VPLNIPPLRQRKVDIPFLADHFARKVGKELGRACEISRDALDRLMEYDWPGNVRELENTIERSMVLCAGDVLGGGEVRLDTGRAKALQPSQFLPDGMNLDQYEQSIIREALRRAGGNKSQAARLLGITRNALRYRLSQMGIDDAAAQAN